MSVRDRDDDQAVVDDEIRDGERKRARKEPTDARQRIRRAHQWECAGELNEFAHLKGEGGAEPWALCLILRDGDAELRARIRMKDDRPRQTRA